jgi:hypothetical protein
MKKKLFFVAIGILLISQTAFGQTKADADYPNLKKQAEELGKATVGGDFSKIVDLTYPKIVEEAGGKDKMIASMKLDVSQMKYEGFDLEAMTVGEIKQVAVVENQIFALVPVTMRIKSPDGKMLGESSIIGISTDGGANWKFINSIDQAGFKKAFPKAAEKIRIPEEQSPKPAANE